MTATQTQPQTVTLPQETPAEAIAAYGEELAGAHRALDQIIQGYVNLAAALPGMDAKRISAVVSRLYGDFSVQKMAAMTLTALADAPAVQALPEAQRQDVADCTVELAQGLSELVPHEFGDQIAYDCDPVAEWEPLS